MSIEIHAHLEVKSNGVWLHFAEPYIKTDYLVFNVIDGAYLEASRNQDEIKPVCKHHCLPDDVSILTNNAYRMAWHEYTPTHVGYLTAEDIKLMQDELYRLDEFAYPTERGKYSLEYSLLNTFVNGGKILDHNGYEDIRLVFWFQESWA